MDCSLPCSGMLGGALGWGEFGCWGEVGLWGAQPQIRRSFPARANARWPGAYSGVGLQHHRFDCWAIAGGRVAVARATAALASNDLLTLGCPAGFWPLNLPLVQRPGLQAWGQVGCCVSGGRSDRFPNAGLPRRRYAQAAQVQLGGVNHDLRGERSPSSRCLRRIPRGPIKPGVEEGSCR